MGLVDGKGGLLLDDLSLGSKSSGRKTMEVRRKETDHAVVFNVMLGSRSDGFLNRKLFLCGVKACSKM